MKEKKEKKLQDPSLINAIFDDIENQKEEIMSKEDKKMGIYCPKCHFDNLADTLYCGKCATPLSDSIDYTRIYEVKEEAEKKDPDLKYDSPNDSHTAIIKRLRHYGEFCSHVYSKEERMTLIKMIQEKDYIALFIEYFKAQIGMIFYGERIYWNSWETAHEITNVQAEIMCSIPIELRKELFNRLKEDVDKKIKWWLEGRLKMKDKAKQLKLEKEAEDEDEESEDHRFQKGMPF